MAKVCYFFSFLSGLATNSLPSPLSKQQDKRLIIHSPPSICMYRQSLPARQVAKFWVFNQCNYFSLIPRFEWWNYIGCGARCTSALDICNAARPDRRTGFDSPHPNSACAFESFFFCLLLYSHRFQGFFSCSLFNPRMRSLRFQDAASYATSVSPIPLAPST
jgi:hypothetical protein